MSRRLGDLTRPMQNRIRQMNREADRRGLEILWYCTYRTPEEQARLWRQGRSLTKIKATIAKLKADGDESTAGLIQRVGAQPGERIVTNALPWRSMHQHRVAADGVPMVDGKPTWDDEHPSWADYGECAMSAGLEWAGNWRTFREFPHVQMPDSDWRQLMAAGGLL